MSQKETSPSGLESTAEEERALSLRTAGKTFRQIAETLQCSLGQAHNLVERALARSKEAMASKGAEYRELEANRLNTLLASLWPVAVGEVEVLPKMDDEGNTRKTVEEATLEGQHKAVDRVLKIMERRAKMLGLDAPIESKVEYRDADKAEREIAAIKSALDARRAASGGAGGSTPANEPGDKGSTGGGS